MTRSGLAAIILLLSLAGCSRSQTNAAANASNDLAAEGGDLNMAIGGDELSPIPEAEDDMIANSSGAGNSAANNAAPPPPAP